MDDFARHIALSKCDGIAYIWFSDDYLDELPDGLFHSEVASHEVVFFRQRVVRTIFCFMCGAALGVSGALMQSVRESNCG
ncbi:hypothetical protein LSPH24S_08095 [Lysinibacillus sphaericus]